MILLTEFYLPIGITAFVDTFWKDNAWYERFLRDHLEDLQISISNWEESPDHDCINRGAFDLQTNERSSIKSINSSSVFSRNIQSYHPSKLSFPGLPSHAESLKTQILIQTYADDESKVIIKETNSFRGIPYSDYFNVNTEWTVKSNRSVYPDKDEECNSMECSIKICLELVFHKSTWLQGTIESNTQAELIIVYDKWLAFAMDTIKRSTKQSVYLSHSHSSVINQAAITGLTTHGDHFLNDLPTTATSVAAQGALKTISTISSNQEAEDLCLPSDEIFITIDESINLSNVLSFVSGININHLDGTFSDGNGSEEDLMFYDCEEGVEKTVNLSSSYHIPSYPYSYSQQQSSRSSSFMNFGDAGSNNCINNNQYSLSPATSQMIGDVSQPSRPLGNRHQLNSPSIDELYSSRDVAVTIVETCFVLTQFSYWQIYGLYSYDLKELFNVIPTEVYIRVLNSFVPGWHSSTILKPDLFGPLIGVFLLPQSLLLSMDVSRNGCSQSSVLGNGVVVSLCLWIGLSFLYRILAFMVAPALGLRQCLSMSGYSFYAWNFALVCSYPLEKYQDYIGLPIALPLAFFGIPAALAQGYIFWEQTPASSMKLRPNAFPTSLQQFAQNNNRWLQRFVWAIPKLITLIVVAGTHYQFLWYIARVFLPGRKQQCKLSALVQPSKYADILTQKELRKYALLLLSGRADDDR